MDVSSRIRRELRVLPVWVAIATFLLSVVTVWPEYDSRTSQRLLSIVGPDLIVLDIVQSTAPVLLVIGFLLAWWRVTATPESCNSDDSDFSELIVALTAILSTVVAAVIVIVVGFHITDAGIPSLLVLPLLFVVTIGYVGTCLTLGAATGVVTSRSIFGRLTTMAAVIGITFFQILVNLVYDIVTTESLNLFFQPSEPALFFFRRFAPFRAYNVLTNWIYGIGNSSSRARITVQQLQPASDTFVTNSFVAEYTFSGSVPWYLSEWTAAGPLVFWFVVSLAVLRWFSDDSDSSRGE